MKYRKLRIAWSVVWGVVAVLLLVLWVWSYWWAVYLKAPYPEGRDTVAVTRSGRLEVEFYYLIAGEISHWQFDTLGPSELSELDDEPTLSGWGFNLYWGVPSGVVVPLWFLVFFSVSLAGLPWIHWPRRFTLRTLLIATTLVAVVLGLIVVVLRWC
jgi:hypothetical protein